MITPHDLAGSQKTNRCIIDVNVRVCSDVKNAWFDIQPGIILGINSANERRRYNVTSPLIAWAHTQNDRCLIQGLLRSGYFTLSLHGNAFCITRSLCGEPPYTSHPSRRAIYGVLIFPFLLNWSICWAKGQIVGDLWPRAHLTSLWGSHSTFNTIHLRETLLKW